MRRFILVAVALGIPLLWAFVPYGRMAPDLTGEPGEARTFAATLLQAAKEAWHDSLITSLINGDIIETIVFMAGFFGLFTLLYPAVIAMQLLAARTLVGGPAALGLDRRGRPCSTAEPIRALLGGVLRVDPRSRGGLATTLPTTLAAARRRSTRWD